MPRPKKMTCDYFSHDKDMRNHRKIKAIRNKLGITGYGIWVMFIETLTGLEENRFKYDSMEVDFMSADFGVSTEELEQFFDYSLKINLIQKSDGFLYSESLNERLENVYQKREKFKAKIEAQKRDKNGQFTQNLNILEKKVIATETTVNGTEMYRERYPMYRATVVSAAEIPQSKVKESKVKHKSIILERDLEHLKENSGRVLSEENNPSEILKKSNLFRQPNPPTKNEVWEFFSRNGGTKEMAKAFFEKYEATGWFLNNSPIVKWGSLANKFLENWKQIESQRTKKGDTPPDVKNVKIKLD